MQCVCLRVESESVRTQEMRIANDLDVDTCRETTTLIIIMCKNEMKTHISLQSIAVAVVVFTTTEVISMELERVHARAREYCYYRTAFDYYSQLHGAGNQRHISR